MTSIARSNKNVRFTLVFDMTPETIKAELLSFAESDPRIEVFHSAHANPGSARNVGLNHLEAEWVTFFDADDSFFVDDLLTVIEAISTEVDVTISNYRICNSSSSLEEKRHLVPNTFMIDANWKAIARYPGIWRWVFRSSTLTNLRFREIRMGEDVCFLVDYLGENRKVYFSDCTAYEYSSQNPNQLTQNSVAMKDLIVALRFALDSIQKSGSSNIELRLDLASLLFYSCLRRSSNLGRFNTLSVMIKFLIGSKLRLRQAFRIVVSRFKVMYG